MNGFFTQIIVAGKNPDSNDLINVLFVVVIGIVYAISGFIKAKARKTSQQEEQPQEPARGAGQRKYGQLSLPESVEIDLPYTKSQDRWADKVKAVRKIQGQAKRSKLPAGVPKGDLSAKSVKTVASEPRIKSILNLESSDDLKKAVLYYEVLGKPVGFRD